MPSGLNVDTLDRSGPTLGWLTDSNGRLCRFRFRDDLAYLTVWGPSAVLMPGWGVPDIKPVLVAHLDRVTGSPFADTLTDAQLDDVLTTLVADLKPPSKTNPLFGDHPDTVAHMVADLRRRRLVEADEAAAARTAEHDDE